MTIPFILIASLGAIGSVYNWGMNVFSYNRDAFMTDIQLKQGRRYFADELKISEVDMHREDIRDLAEAQLQWLNNIILVETLILGLAGEVLVEGSLPERTADFVANAFMLCLASTMLYLVIGIALAIIAAQLAAVVPTNLLTTRVRPAWASYRKTMKARRAQEATTSFEQQNAQKLFTPPMWPFWKMRLMQAKSKWAGKIQSWFGGSQHSYSQLPLPAASGAVMHDEPEMEIDDDRLGEEEILQERWLKEHWRPSERRWKPYREKSMIAFILGTKSLLETYGYLCVAQLYGPHHTAWAFWLILSIFVFLNYCWGVFLENHLSRFAIVGGPVMCIIAASTGSRVVDKIFVPLCFFFHIISNLVLYYGLGRHEEMATSVAQRMTSYFPGWQKRDQSYGFFCPRRKRDAEIEEAEEVAEFDSPPRGSVISSPGEDDPLTSKVSPSQEDEECSELPRSDSPTVKERELGGRATVLCPGVVANLGWCPTVERQSQNIDRKGTAQELEEAILGRQEVAEASAARTSELQRQQSEVLGMETPSILMRNIASGVESAEASPMSPMIKAGRRGNLEIVLLLYEHDAGRADMSTLEFWEQDQHGSTPLHKACSEGCFDLVRLWLSDEKAACLERARATMSMVDRSKSTPLHHACSKGDVGILKLLLKYLRPELLEQLTAEDVDGCTPLHRACIAGYAGVVRLLVDRARKDMKLCTQLCNAAKLCDRHGCTPFEAACESGHTQVVEVLLDPCEVGHGPHFSGLDTAASQMSVRQASSLSAANVLLAASTVVCMMWVVAFAWAVDGACTDAMQFQNSQAWWKMQEAGPRRHRGPELEESQDRTINVLWPSPHFKPRHLACSNSHIFLADQFRVFQMSPDIRWPTDNVQHNLTNIPCKITGPIGDVASECIGEACKPTVLLRGADNENSRVVNCDTGEAVPLLQALGQAELVASKSADTMLTAHGTEVVEYERTRRGWLPRWSVAHSDSKLKALDSKQGRLLLMFSEGILDVRDLDKGSRCGRWSIPKGVISGCTWTHKNVAMVLIRQSGQPPSLVKLRLPELENCGFNSPGQLSEM